MKEVTILKTCVRILIILIAVIVSSHLVSAQSPPGRKEVNTKGWKTPRLDRLTKSKEIVSKSNDDTISETKFSIKRGDASTWLRKDLYCEFRNLSSFASLGKIFAVRGDCVVFSTQVSKSGHYRFTTKTYAAAITHYTFYDEDGDGTFESRYNTSESSEAAIIVPRWLKK